ncbi:angiopoietin 1 [Mytilus galloprovincialis]|uniref:Angiopoietin 1 n=2 Tax=Mytilus galloprovincialis TaxID=29158 RepID=A0A8B6BK54_MYTGA|nr:angiopoietin 1 [Mytilus galloprovincialis]
MMKYLIYLGLICSEHLLNVKATNTGDDMVETPIVDNQNVPLLAMFDMTKVNKRIKAYFSDTFESKMSDLVQLKLEDVLLSLKIDEDVKQYIESIKGNLTMNIEKEIKNYFDDVKQNLTASISEGIHVYEATSVALQDVRNETKRMQDDMKSFWNSLQEVQQFIANQSDNLYEHKHHQCGGALQDCGDLKGTSCTSGMYILHLNGLSPFRGYCNMVPSGGGWTVIQRRQDGSENFYRGWDDYKNGFGNLTGEFWLGNEHIYKLTSQGNYQLRITLEDWNGDTVYATYKTFSLGNEDSSYKLTIGGYSGTAGDSMAYNNGKAFSTKDKGNRCAQTAVGAWWYGSCTYSNLNGEYLRGKTSSDKDSHRGVAWHYWKNRWNYSLMKSEMMIRKP